MSIVVLQLRRYVRKSLIMRNTAVLYLYRLVQWTIRENGTAVTFFNLYLLGHILMGYAICLMWDAGGCRLV